MNRCLQAWAYPGIALFCVFISRGLDAKTHGHQRIAYVCTDVHIAYSVVVKYVLPEYPHSSASAYAVMCLIFHTNEYWLFCHNQQV